VGHETNLNKFKSTETMWNVFDQKWNRKLVSDRIKYQAGGKKAWYAWFNNNIQG